MKIFQNFSRARVAGFTLLEIYTSVLLFSFLVIAIVAIQLFAARVYTLAATKLSSTASGRYAMNTLREAIRSADDVEVGTYDPAANTFSNIPIGTLQIGNALVIYSNNPNGNNTNFGTIYFVNTAASNMCSVNCSNNTVLTSTLTTQFVVYITNYYAFDAEDAFTNILTNYLNNRVIHVKLQFARWEYPFATVASSNGLYDYYQLQTRATRRIIDY